MFSTLSRRWFSLFASLLLVLTGLPPVSAAAITPPFSVGVKAGCLGCTLGEQFPVLRTQLQGEVPWTASTRHFGKRPVAGFAVTASADLHPPEELKPLERRAWVAMAERGQMQLFLPQRYDGSTVVEQGAVQVQLQPLGAQPARAEQQGKTLVYKDAYPSTDSLQVVKPGRSEEFLYLRERSAPQKFDYRVRVGQGVQLRSVGGGIAFVDSRGRGVRIDRPWLVDSSGRHSESAVHWQVLDGGKRLRLVVEPRGLSYPVVVDPSWTTTDSMTTARSLHTATLLQSGQVLVAGGSGNSSELYDPQTGTWSNTGSMAVARQSHTATLLPNGTVLVTGGQNSNGYLSGAELYDPVTGIWTTTGSLTTARANHTETLLPTGKVLVAGGTNSSSSFYLSSAELYDPSTGTWSTAGTMSTLRSLHTATLLNNGQVLVAGGFVNGSTAELYDPQTGTWTPTSSMSTARSRHTATLLPNGQVLVAAGFNSNSDSSAELYDPQTGTWTTTGSLTTTRADHTATLLPNGQVLVAGGVLDFSFSSLSSAELYDPQTGTWSTTGSMSTARADHTETLLLNGKVLVAGGATSSTSTTSSTELYDPPSTGTWSTTGSMGTARRNHTATLLQNGQVLVAGGSGNSAELYDPQTGTWTPTGSMATGRRSHTATLLPNGTVLVAGGLYLTINTAIGGVVSTTLFSTNSAELYDPTSGTWTTTGSMSTARADHTNTFLPNGRVLVAGGISETTTTTTGGITTTTLLSTNSAELYDLTSGTWTTTGSMGTARADHTNTFLPDGKVLVVGGQNSNGTLSSAELYDPQTGTWTATGSMVTARHFHAATLLPNGKVLVAGGYNGGSSYLSSAELYDPSTGNWSSTGSLNVGRGFHTATLLPSGTVLVAGGTPDASLYSLSSAELYDPQTGIWTTTGSMTTSRYDHTAMSLPNGTVLVAGGVNSNSALSGAELYGLGAPSVTSFSPTSAPIGSIVTVTGSGFTGVTSVTINDLSASFGFISDSQLNLQVPPGATSGPITVTTPNSSGSSVTSLTVLGTVPIVNSFSPTRGPVGTTVTINGTNFTGVTGVRFRTTAASFTFISDSEIQAVVPAGAKLGAIVVTTPAGSNTSPTKFIVTP